jgi:hypothetical protein
VRRRRLIVLSVVLIGLALIIGGLWYWQSEQWAEQKLQEYIRRLEDEGYNIEEHSLADFHVNSEVRIQFFGDFRSLAEEEGMNYVYFDRGIHALYFLRPIENGIEANIFYYK